MFPWWSFFVPIWKCSCKTRSYLILLLSLILCFANQFITRKILKCFPKSCMNSLIFSWCLLQRKVLGYTVWEQIHWYITDLALPYSSLQQLGLSSSISEAPPASYRFWLDSEPTNSLSEKNCLTCFQLSQSICSKISCDVQNSSSHLELSGKPNPV